MLSAPIAAAERLAEEWQAEVARREQWTAHDPVAEALARCAEQLLATIAPFKEPNAVCTLEEWARENGVSAQTARNYIRRGWLKAETTPKGFRVMRNAKAEKPASVSQAGRAA